MNQGLTNKEMQQVSDLLIKSNDEQLTFIKNITLDEQLKRCKVLL